MSQNKQHLREKSNEILQEFRIVLPGTQALLGFQLIAFFNQVFHDLPDGLQHLHFAAFMLTAISTITLIAPVAFQQVGEGGHTTERFLHFARSMLNGAMFLLLLSLTCEVYVVAKTIAMSTPLAAAFSAITFLTGAFLWYFYVLIQKKNT